MKKANGQYFPEEVCCQIIKLIVSYNFRLQITDMAKRVYSY